MKITIKDYDSEEVAVMEVPGGTVHLSNVFSGVGIETLDDGVFGVCQRDSGLEITCPDGTLVGVKLDSETGEVVIERNRGTVNPNVVGGDLLGAITHLTGPVS